MRAIGLWWLLSVVLVVAAGCARQVAQPSGQGPSSPPSGASKATEPGGASGERATGVGTGKIEWNYDYADGLKKAKEAGKPVMVDVFATWCGPCKRLDEEVFSRADVAEASKAFVTVRIDGDKHPDLVEKLKVKAYPTVLFLTPDGAEIGRSLGAVGYQDMLDSMASAKEKYQR